MLMGMKNRRKNHEILSNDDYMETMLYCYVSKLKKLIIRYKKASLICMIFQRTNKGFKHRQMS